MNTTFKWILNLCKTDPQTAGDAFRELLEEADIPSEGMTDEKCIASINRFVEMCESMASGGIWQAKVYAWLLSEAIK